MLTGLLRKKGMFLHNERIVRISTEGVLTYSNRDKPGREKGQINLRALGDVRFIYAGKRVTKDSKADLTVETAGSVPHPDDEMRFSVKRDNFFFKSMTKLDTQPAEWKEGDLLALPISAWETVIRRFSKKVSITYLQH